MQRVQTQPGGYAEVGFGVWGGGGAARGLNCAAHWEHPRGVG